VAGAAEAALGAAVDDAEALGAAVRELRARAAAQEGRILAMQASLAGRAGEGARLRREVEGLRLELQLAREEAAQAAERAAAEREVLAGDVADLRERCERAEGYARHLEAAAHGELGRLKSLRSSILRIEGERQRWSRDALRPLRMSVGELPSRGLRRSARLAGLLASPFRASVDNSLLHVVPRGGEEEEPPPPSASLHASEGEEEALAGLTVQERLLDLNGLGTAFRGFLDPRNPSPRGGAGSPVAGGRLQGDGLFLPSGVLTPQPFSPDPARRPRGGGGCGSPGRPAARRGPLTFAEEPEDSFFVATPGGGRHGGASPPPGAEEDSAPRRATPDRSPFQQRRGAGPGNRQLPEAVPGGEALAAAAAASASEFPSAPWPDPTASADLLAAVKSSAEGLWGAMGWAAGGGAPRASAGEASQASSEGTPAPRAPLGTISNTAPARRGGASLPASKTGRRGGGGGAEEVLAAAALLASPPLPPPPPRPPR